MPYVLLDDSDGKTELIVQLALLDESFDLPDEFKTHRCKGTEFRAFRLETDSDQWQSYWAESKKRREFSYGVVLPGLVPPVRAHSIGIAFVNRSSGESAVSCGCLAR